MAATLAYAKQSGASWRLEALTPDSSEEVGLSHLFDLHKTIERIWKSSNVKSNLNLAITWARVTGKIDAIGEIKNVWDSTEKILCAHVSPLDHEEDIPVFRVFQVLDPQSKLVNVFGRSNVILEGIRLAAELHTSNPSSTTKQGSWDDKPA
ncbi:hypothetical protein K443DRAFT_123751 [Laccaria amethystina LaAM-08-1]|uniref:Uncharacterized protein n=1 Tax=Laccaria amethystina LaAM-08-1 TaxID=1095629 RepID=A0A0C9XA09_9AGAR|nr:hypothetical protein K443DRAFT_123751 [Laccaria amethystina LaAM-08-1]